MFTYWPFISLIVAGVMVTILLVLKFSEKLCGARFSAQHRPRGGAAGGSQHQVSLDLGIIVPALLWRIIEHFFSSQCKVTAFFNQTATQLSTKMRKL